MQLMPWAVAAIAEHERPKCTGVAARWCPIHGDCECSEEDDYNDQECPLHSIRSTHAEEGSPHARSD
jgi:hypothetical protein